jgi:hypothetical protein
MLERHTKTETRYKTLCFYFISLVACILLNLQPSGEEESTEKKELWLPYFSPLSF